MGSISHKRQRQQFWSKKKRSSMVISKKGALIKQSNTDIPKRRRSIILSQHFIATFDNVEDVPTAVIPLSIISSLLKEEEQRFLILKITTRKQEEYRFRTETYQEREDWYAKIKQLKMKALRNSFESSSVKTEENTKGLFFIEEK